MCLGELSTPMALTVGSGHSMGPIMCLGLMTAEVTHMGQSMRPRAVPTALMMAQDPIMDLMAGDISMSRMA